MKKNIGLFLFCICIYACGKDIPESRNKIDYSKVVNNSSRLDGAQQDLVFDTIVISTENENELNSMDGDFFLKGDTICFADRGLASIFMYNLEGELLRTRITKGRGANEVLSLSDITPLKNGGYAIMGDSWDIYMFDSLWKGVGNTSINWGDWGSEENFQNIKNNPDPNLSVIYETVRCKNNFRSMGDNHLLFPIVTEHVNYNGIQSASNADHFYENSYSLGMLDIESGKLNMMCNRSPIYSEYNLPNFHDIILDTDNETLYFSFQVDSLIYQYNLKDSSICSFGYAGQNMNTEYEETNTLEEEEDQDMQGFGWYTDLSYEPKTNTLFRSFRCGDPTQTHGLQVYRNQKLIGEYDVPDGFNVIGYLAPYYYGFGMHDYENGEMYIYRFEL